MATLGALLLVKKLGVNGGRAWLEIVGDHKVRELLVDRLHLRLSCVRYLPDLLDFKLDPVSRNSILVSLKRVQEPAFKHLLDPGLTELRLYVLLGVLYDLSFKVFE